MFDMYASQVHYCSHLLPVWYALPEEERGQFYGPAVVAEMLASEGIHPLQGSPPLDVRPIVVAGWQDVMRCPGRPIALLEHGAGQTYQNCDNPSFAGGDQRERVDLFLCPSSRVAEANLTRYPDATAAVVGCPKLDQWAGSQLLDTSEIPTVAVSFHWDCLLLPETRWAFPAFEDHITQLARFQDIKLIGHAHPRALRQVEWFYQRYDIEVVPDFDDVVRRSSAFICDNSSAIYEAAFADIPVLCLDAPWYRPDVEHGLRFWSDIPGLHIGVDDDIRQAVAVTLLDSDEAKVRRRDIVSRVYEVQEDAAIHAAAVLVEHLHETDAPKPRTKGHPYRPPSRQLPPILPERRLRRLGANGLVLNEARLRWVEMSRVERREEQERLAALTDRELSRAIAETLVDEVVGVG